MADDRRIVAASIDPYRIASWRVLAFFFRYLVKQWHLYALLILVIMAENLTSAHGVLLPIVARIFIDNVFPNADCCPAMASAAILPS